MLNTSRPTHALLPRDGMQILVMSLMTTPRLSISTVVYESLLRLGDMQISFKMAIPHRPLTPVPHLPDGMQIFVKTTAPPQPSHQDSRPYLCQLQVRQLCLSIPAVECKSSSRLRFILDPRLQLSCPWWHTDLRKDSHIYAR